jgi:hypothetical protein
MAGQYRHHKEHTLIRHWTGLAPFAIAATLGISLSACAGGAQNGASPSADIPQPARSAQRTSPNSITPYWPIAVTESFSPASFYGGGTSKLTITLTSNKFDPFTYTPLTFTETLPANLIVASGPAGVLSNTCGGQASVDAVYTTFGIKNATLQSQGASCSITMLISGHVPGTYDNAIPAGAAKATNAETSTAANANVTVLQPHVIPKP